MAKHLGRRGFLGITGAVAGAGMITQKGCANVKESVPSIRSRGGMRADIEELVRTTPLVDTHEHLWEESHRIRTKAEKKETPALDFGLLLSHYTDSDLQVAGLSGNDYQKLISGELAPRDKWNLVQPYYERCRHTGYQLCVRESIRALYGEEDLRKDNCESISEKLAAHIQPGFYKHILQEIANIEYCQVNALDQPVFRETEQPELLAQDLWTISIASQVNMATLTRMAGEPVKTLERAHAVIDHCFDTYGPRAIAVKDQCAYGRRLLFEHVPDAAAAPLFERFAKDEKSLSESELKAVQNNLFRHCLVKATEYNLPVKLHTGYYAGHGGMPLDRVRRNAGDLCSLLKEYSGTKFVLMHIDYPYQDEAIALAKHYPNAYIDMCWAWIINPAASVRFLKEFIMAAPACKLFTFGGDYMPVELVPGHARVARMGIARALAELLEEGWLAESDAPALADRLMRGNAHEVFDHQRTLRNWKRS